jgi:hypothetical protein
MRAGSSPSFGSWQILLAVLVRPDLWWSGLGAVRRLAAPGWWKSSPYLPMPDERLWGFRMVTAYGSPHAVPDAADVISYLKWCKSTAPHRRIVPTKESSSWPTGRHHTVHSG